MELHYKPRIWIVDDKLHTVEHLEKEFAMLGCNVKCFASEAAVISALDHEIVDVFLVDVQLIAINDDDRSGVTLAETLVHSNEKVKAKTAPEAFLIFISRPDIIDADDVLRMFNLRVGNIGRPRLAEGYAEKTETETIRGMVEELLRARHSWGLEGAASITLSPETNDRLIGQLSLKFSESTEPQQQFIRLIRQLCMTAYSSATKVFVSDVSKGRSRSIVVNTRVEHGDKLVESRIIKIGQLQTIQKEVQNYRTHVPRLLRGGAYPLMTGYASCRELAGIGYSELGGGGGIPDSFADCFWEFDFRDKIKLLDVLLHGTICDSGGAQMASRVPFLRRYRERFQSLAVKHPLHKLVDAQVKKARSIRCDQNLEKIVIHSGNIRQENCLHPRFAVIHEMPQWHGGPYMECIVHGDFHPDNILLHLDRKKNGGDEVSGTAFVHDGGTLRSYLIDFTHTEANHASLDYIVMDAMLRSQLLRGVLQEVSNNGGSSSQLRTLCEKWIRAEILVFQGDFSKALEEFENEGRPGEQLRDLMMISDWLRKAAFRRNFAEGFGFYCAGFGFTCYAFLSLPDKSAMNEYCREILLVVSSLAFTKAIREGIGGAWLGAAGKQTEFCRRLAESLSLWEGYLVRAIRAEVRTLREDGALSRVRNISDLLAGEEWKEFRRSLETVSKTVSRETRELANGRIDVLQMLIASRFFKLVKDLGIHNDDCYRIDREIWERLRAAMAST